MKKLIFGCGYLGQRVAKSWIEAGDEVYAITRSTEKAESFRQSGIRPIVADICDIQSLGGLPEVDVILHAVGFDRTTTRTHADVTCGGLANILAAIRYPIQRFLYVSSISVYGQSAGEWVDETSERNPTQPNGILCLEAERLVEIRFSSDPTESMNILRLAGIYGPGRLLNRVESLKAGTPISGRGDAWLNLIHVDDACQAVIACERQGNPNDSFIVVDDQPITRAEYFSELARLVSAPTPTFDASQARTRGSDGLNKRCSNRTTKERLNWQPRYASIAKGLPASLD